jgi:hypothetical protein
MSRGAAEPPHLYGVIPYEFASEIANIVSHFAQLEYNIDTVIWELAGLSDMPNGIDIGACLTAQIPAVVPRIEALIALARVQGVPEDRVRKLNKFKEHARSVGERRHRVAHDPWFATWKNDWPECDVYRLQRTAKAKLEHGYKQVAIDELKALTADIQATIEEFNDLGSEILRAFWTLPETPPATP